ncbi:MAG TPA: substrate-binding domain-containing protein [Terriglobales bacterium]|nr:substrate-binding domain-containing protein [Terriglobales bacterium]
MKKLLLAAGSMLLTSMTLALAPQAAHADADGSCAGKKFVFFPGGGEGDTFASIVYRGAQLAQKQTGCHVDYVWSDWNPEKMVAQFKEQIARKPTGISIMGHPGEGALSKLIDEARADGIIVTTANVDLPDSEGKYKGDGMGYVGQRLYPSGEMLGNAAFDICQLKSGDKALVWGLMGQQGRGERTKGVVDALKAKGVNVQYLEISDSVNKDPSQGVPVFSAYFQSNPDTKAVITDHGTLTATIPLYFKNANADKDKVCGAGFDLSAPTAQAIKSGYVKAVLDQQPFLQGYLPILQMYLTSKFGFAGFDVDTGAAIISSKNIDAVAPFAKEGIR